MQLFATGKQQADTWFGGWFNIDRFKPYFDVDGQLVLRRSRPSPLHALMQGHRCLFSLLPRSAASRDSIDLYGPSTIVFSLVVLLHYEFSAHGKVATIAVHALDLDTPHPTAGISPQHIVCDGAHILGARLPRAARVLLPQLHRALPPSDRRPHGAPSRPVASYAFSALHVASPRATPSSLYVFRCWSASLSTRSCSAWRCPCSPHSHWCALPCSISLMCRPDVCM